MANRSIYFKEVLRFRVDAQVLRRFTPPSVSSSPKPAKGLSPFGSQAAHSLLTRLTRLSRRRPEQRRFLEEALESNMDRMAELAIRVTAESGDPLGQVLAVRAKEVPIDVSERMLALCQRADYQASVPLREVAYEVERRGLEALGTRWPDPSQDQSTELALGSDLSALGRWEEALEARREAVATYPGLYQAHGGAFLPDLVSSLTGLGSILSALGRQGEAQEATLEAR